MSVASQVSALVSDYEIIIVDSGSNDEEFSDYSAMVGATGLPNLQIYRLNQYVDNDIASWAGVENSLGDYVLVYDPRSESLERLEDALKEIGRGCDVVYLRNTASTDSGLVERLLGTLFRSSFRLFSGIDLTVDATPGRLISKRIVSFLMQQPRPAMRYRVLPSMSGFQKTTLLYAAPRQPDPRRRLAGRIRSAVNLLVSSTIAPLRLVSIGTLLSAGINVLYSCYVVAIAITKSDVQPGWTTLSLQISGMFFLLSLAIFVLVEYLIQMIRWNASGPSYFLTGEATSAILTRRQKLNVESASGGTSGHDA